MAPSTHSLSDRNTCERVSNDEKASDGPEASAPANEASAGGEGMALPTRNLGIDDDDDLEPGTPVRGACRGGGMAPARKQPRDQWREPVTPA